MGVRHMRGVQRILHQGCHIVLEVSHDGGAGPALFLVDLLEQGHLDFRERMFLFAHVDPDEALSNLDLVCFLDTAILGRDLLVFSHLRDSRASSILAGEGPPMIRALELTLFIDSTFRQRHEPVRTLILVCSPASPQILTIRVIFITTGGKNLTKSL